jgi:Uma2 family endonuclease
MTMEEYLSLPFPDLEREPEFVRDHLEEKLIPDDDHAAIQSYLANLLVHASTTTGKRIYVRSELRVRLANSVRLPDLVAYLESPRQPANALSLPPYAVFEITSPEEKFESLFEKLNEYVAWGAQHIFVIEPRLRQTFRYSSTGLDRIDAIVLPEIAFNATIADLVKGI